MIVKCVTCQRTYDSTKFSVDCPHDVELSADLLRSSQPRPPVSVPPYSPASGKPQVPPYRHENVDPSSHVPPLMELDTRMGNVAFLNPVVSSEDITDEMVKGWQAANAAVAISDGWPLKPKSMMAAAINIYREHTAINTNLDH